MKHLASSIALAGCVAFGAGCSAPPDAEGSAVDTDAVTYGTQHKLTRTTTSACAYTSDDGRTGTLSFTVFEFVGTGTVNKGFPDFAIQAAASLPYESRHGVDFATPKPLHGSYAASDLARGAGAGAGDREGAWARAIADLGAKGGYGFGTGQALGSFQLTKLHRATAGFELKATVHAALEVWNGHAYDKEDLGIRSLTASCDIRH